MKTAKHLIRRLLIWALKVFLVLLVLSILLPLVFRFVHPPLSMMMIYRKAVGLATGRHCAIHYEWVAMDRINPRAGLAVIAAEDQLFMEHHGFDFNSIWKALRYRNRTKYLHGASTITQQTAKNLFLVPDRTILRKIAEAYLTVVLETVWSKQRILEIYLNIVEFGEGVYGVKAASARFFHKSPEHLNSEEAALLAGALPNPRRLKVNAPSEYLLERQQWIMGQMNALGGVETMRPLMNRPAKSSAQ